jgi:hypothetical protein
MDHRPAQLDGFRLGLARPALTRWTIMSRRFREGPRDRMQELPLGRDGVEHTARAFDGGGAAPADRKREIKLLHVNIGKLIAERIFQSAVRKTSVPDRRGRLDRDHESCPYADNVGWSGWRGRAFIRRGCQTSLPDRSGQPGNVLPTAGIHTTT